MKSFRFKYNGHPQDLVLPAATRSPLDLGMRPITDPKVVSNSLIWMIDQEITKTEFALASTGDSSASRLVLSSDEDITRP